MFAGVQGGLLKIKLEQLAACAEVDRIVLSTNDPAVIAVAKSLRDIWPKLEIDNRPDSLCESTTSTDELVRYVPNVVPDGTVLWTHVTSPFVGPAMYTKIVEEYRSARERSTHDSLMTVTPLREFLWNDHGPINYAREAENWPRTQTIEPVYVVNSAAFVIEADLLSRIGDRVGERPLLYELGLLDAIDIDWPEQFQLAETLYAQRKSS